MYTHAYLMEGTSVQNSDIPDNIKNQSVDVQHVVTTTFTIDDARSLVQTASLRGMESDNRTFVLCFSQITVEAQNALLKLIEEPPIGVVFYVLVPHTALLIPTLRSRFISVTEDAQKGAESSVANAFLSASYSDRIATIAEKTKEKDLAWMQQLLQELGYKISISSVSTKKALARADRYINIRGASRKMLLENLALSLPIK